LTAADLIHRANAAGVQLRLDDSGELKASGHRDAIEGLLPDLKAHKAEIAQLLAESRVTLEALTAAMKLCDFYADGESAREQMKRDVLETPPHLMPDLRDHLRGRVEGLSHD